MFLHVWHPHPILFHLGPLAIHWYGLTLALGTLAGFFIIRWVATHYDLGEPVIFDLFIVLIIFGLIGARLYHVSNEWPYYSQHPAQIFQIWNGGLAWHGGLIAGVTAAYIFSRIKKINFWLLSDIVVPGLALGQAIGRWGNYFNQELFGRPSGLPWSIPIDLANRPTGYLQFQYFHPTFLYESLGSLAILGILLWLHVRRWRHKPVEGWANFTQRGFICLLYLALAAGLRMATESLRIDHTPIIGGVRLPIIVGGLIIILAAILWTFLFTQRRRAHAA